MRLEPLIVLYLLVGAACALAIWRRAGGRRPLQAALAIPLWPLWAPVVLSEPEGGRPQPSSDAAARIEQALSEGVDVATATPLEAMLNAASAERIAQMARRAGARRAELGELLARPEFDLDSAKRRLEELTGKGHTRGLATARLHLANVERLHAMAARDDDLLRELGELAEALRTQLLMVRFAGSSGEGIGDIVNDLWSRVEALSEAMGGGQDGGQAASDDEQPAHPGRG